MPGNAEDTISVIPVGKLERGHAAMVSHYAEHQTMAASQPGAGLVTRAVEQVRQFICGLHGHDALLHFEQGRLSLQCTSCSYETPGWDLKKTPAHADLRERPSRILQMPFVRERRVA